MTVFENCPCADGGAPPFADTNWYCESSVTYICDSSATMVTHYGTGLAALLATAAIPPTSHGTYTELSKATTNAIENRVSV